MGLLEDFSEWLVPSAGAADLASTMRYLQPIEKKLAPELNRVIETLTTKYPSVKATQIVPDIDRGFSGGVYRVPGDVGRTRTLEEFLSGSSSINDKFVLPHSNYAEFQSDPQTLTDFLRAFFHEHGHGVAGSQHDSARWLTGPNYFPYIDENKPIQEGFADAMSGLANRFKATPTKEELKNHYYWDNFKLAPASLDNIDPIIYDSYLSGGRIGRNFALELLEGGVPSQESTIKDLMGVLDQAINRRREGVMQGYGPYLKDSYRFNRNYPLFNGMILR